MSTTLRWLGLRLLFIGLMVILAWGFSDLLSHQSFHCIFIAPHRGFCYFW